MKNDEIKQANRKALPKFLLFAVVCTIIGGVIGYYSGHSAAKGGLDQLVGTMKEAGAFFGTHIAPWLMLALAVIVPVVCIPIYRSANKLVAVWDGEDEDISDTVDRKLSLVIWITSAALIVSYFLMAASYSGGIAIFDDKKRTIIFLLALQLFSELWLRRLLFSKSAWTPPSRQIPKRKHPSMICGFKKSGLTTAMKPRKL